MAAADFSALRDYLGSQIVGQEELIEGLLIALLCEGHVLIEGAPGLAKTRAVKALAGAVEGRFARIQFTPDLLPADLTGSEVFHPQDASFVFQPGPLFNHLVLADEINRAPAKVQSALLEAMAEHQITVGKKSWRLPPLFMVAATQNPIEQEGTYPLPEAQLDRFLLKLMVDYPSPAMELTILQLNACGETAWRRASDPEPDQLARCPQRGTGGHHAKPPGTLSGGAGLCHPPGQRSVPCP